VPTPDRPIAAEQRAYLLPRADVAFQQYVDLWIRQAQADGTFQRAGQPPVDRLTSAVPR
jgi:cyclohexadienyl dehydratase